VHGVKCKFNNQLECQAPKIDVAVDDQTRGFARHSKWKTNKKMFLLFKDRIMPIKPGVITLATNLNSSEELSS